MARTDPQVNIRLPAELLQRLEVAAAENQRAFKAEIVARLERSFTDETELAELRQQAKRDDEIFTQFHRNQETLLRRVGELTQRVDTLTARREGEK